MVARGQRAVLYVPIVAGDQVVGFLCAIERRHSRRFTKADEALRCALAAEAAWRSRAPVPSTGSIPRTASSASARGRGGDRVERRSAYHAVDYRRTARADPGRRLVGCLRLPRRRRRARGDRLLPGLRGAERLRLAGPALQRGVVARGPRHGAPAPAAARYYDYSRLSFEDFVAMAAWGEKATLSVPLVYGDEVFGVLDVAESRYPRRFTADEVRLAEAIGAQAAVAIHNARAFDEAERRNADLATLLGVAATLSSAVDRAACWRPSPGTFARLWARPAPRSTSTTPRGAPSSWSPPTRRHAASTPRLVRHLPAARRPAARRAASTTAEWSAVQPATPSARRSRGGLRAAATPASSGCRWSTRTRCSVCSGEPRRRPTASYSQRRDRPGDGIAAQAAAALQNARAYERLEQERAALRRPEPAPVGLRRAVGPDARPALRGAADRPARPRPARDPRVQSVGDLPLRSRRGSSSAWSRRSAARPRSTSTTPRRRSPHA